MLAPYGFLVPVYRMVLGGYLDTSALRQFDELMALWDQAPEAVRAAQHHYQDQVESGARATTSLSWFIGSAMVDLILGKIAHEVIKRFFQAILTEAEFRIPLPLV
jgi:hypothetical protein